MRHKQVRPDSEAAVLVTVLGPGRVVIQAAKILITDIEVQLYVKVKSAYLSYFCKTVTQSVISMM